MASPTPQVPAPVAPFNSSNLKTVKQTAERGPLGFSSLRWLLFNRAENGLAVAVVRVGRRTFIDLDAYDRWLAAQREAV